MIGEYKQFDRDLYNKNNQAAVDAVLRHILLQGGYARSNYDLYGPDIQLYSGYKHYSYIEVEIKQIWTTNPFPYETVQLPERKSKFLKLGKPLEFWILRSDLKFALVLADKLVEDSPLVEVPNKYVAAGERFFQVPVQQAILVELEAE